MLTSPWITCLWPGLTEMWVHGRWRGLIWASLFTLLLNVTLILKAVWPELAGEAVRSGLWYLLCIFWLASVVVSVVRVINFDPNSVDETEEALFQTAQSEYLRGNLHQTEATLLRLFRKNPCDTEGLLMMATLMRHTKRFAEARSTLEKLQQLDAANTWQEEITREYHLLSDRENDSEETEEEPSEQPEEATDSTDQQPIREAA